MRFPDSVAAGRRTLAVSLFFHFKIILFKPEEPWTLPFVRLSALGQHSKHAADRDTERTVSVGLSAGGRSGFQHPVNYLQGR